MIIYSEEYDQNNSTQVLSNKKLYLNQHRIVFQSI